MNIFIEKLANQLSKVRQLDIYMAGHDGFIAGGCFKNIFSGEKIKDVDVFFENEEQFKKADDYFSNNDDYVFSYQNSNTKAYKNTITNIRVELIQSTYGTPNEILCKFDFSITKFAYCKRDVIDGDSPISSIEYYCYYHAEFFEHLTLKRLVLEPTILFPVSTFERSYRYRTYGYGLCKESKINLINALQGVDTSTISNELYFGLD